MRMMVYQLIVENRVVWRLFFGDFLYYSHGVS